MNQHQRIERERNSKKLEIYVAGLPPSVDHNMLKSYFRQYGRISKIYIYFQKKGETGLFGEDKVKVHCKLILPDEQTYTSIIEEKNHFFFGRNLFCKEFKKGNPLKLHNTQLILRRVIVKKAPFFLVEEDIKELLESKFGAVESIYEFKTDIQYQSTALNKKFKSFSVTFRSDLVTNQFSKPLHFYFDQENFFILERFEPSVANRNDIIDTSTSPQTLRNNGRGIIDYSEHNLFQKNNIHLAHHHPSIVNGTTKNGYRQDTYSRKKMEPINLLHSNLPIESKSGENKKHIHNVYMNTISQTDCNIRMNQNIRFNIHAIPYRHLNLHSY